MSDELVCDICKRPRWDGGHAINERECANPNGTECRLRRDLATRDRELAEAREGETRAIRLYETAETNHAKDVRLGIDAAVETVSRGYQRDLDQAHAALAEKEREAKFNHEAWQECAKRADNASLALAAAQEEAKGLRTALEQVREIYLAWQGSERAWRMFGAASDAIAKLRTKAARQQQPDGKPDPAPVASETCRSCKGYGLVRVLVPGVVGSYQIHQRCRDCSGTGKTP